LTRADGQKTYPSYFRGLLAGHLAARQKAETGQGHAALNELATAIAVHSHQTAESLRFSRGARAHHAPESTDAARSPRASGAPLAHRIDREPDSRKGTFYEASAVKLQFRVIRHERQRSDMLLAACLDIRPGRKASDDLLSVPTTRVGHPILHSLCGESRQAREEVRPFSVAALSSGPVPLSSGSHQVAQSLRRSSASDRDSRYAG